MVLSASITLDSEFSTLRGLIRELRTECGATQVTLSEQMGRSQSFLSDIERGVRRIDALELRDLCQLLDTDLPYLIAELERRIESLTPIPKTRRTAKAKPVTGRTRRTR